MQRTRSAFELMAPVGSWESLAAAIDAGADSVYFGIDRLNMRSGSASAFALSDLAELAHRCAQANVASYLTLNAVIFDEDLSSMRETIDEARRVGISAIVAMDVAAIEYARSVGVVVHLSTQVNVTNVEAIRFFSRYADAVVLAREVTLDRAAAICRAIEEREIRGPSGRLIRVELFVHGALCMAISGKCYLSLHEYDKSANRGACAQPCRKTYRVVETTSGTELEIDNERILSPKDLCTIDVLDRILDAGVSILKIEGRARSPEYVKTVVECYREAVEAYAQGTYRPEKVEAWTTRLKSVFHRGLWNGYYLGQRLGKWSTTGGSQATKVKTYVGKVTNFFERVGALELKIEAEGLCVGDEVLVIGPQTGVVETRVVELRTDAREAASVAVRGDVVTMSVDRRVRRSDKLYKLVPAQPSSGGSR